MALSYSEADEATRRYQHAEKLIKAKEGLANDGKQLSTKVESFIVTC